VTWTASAEPAAANVRRGLVDALRLDLVGPWPGHSFADERLPGWIRPSNWYLTGFLIPSGAPPEQSADVDEEDEVGAIPESEGNAEESNEDRKAAKKAFFPSSMGLSFLISANTGTLAVEVTWGDYTQELLEEEEEKELRVWQRHARAATVAVSLSGKSGEQVRDIPDSKGLQLHVVERTDVQAVAGQLPPGTRSVSVFLVNRRAPAPAGAEPDLAYAFQPALEIRTDEPFVPRPNLRGAQAEEWDELVADLHYADTPEYATGHGISAEWEIVDDGCRLLRTAWIPDAEVERTVTAKIADVELSMDALGALDDGTSARAALAPLVEQYRAWILTKELDLDELTDPRRETAVELLRLAGIAADRIERGIDVLTTDDDALDAFRIANRAVSRALKQRLDETEPQWRAFQLAFILLNLPGLADPVSPDRQIVDLLFFPTGGGKTEAYLGLAAFTMVLRRRRHPENVGLAGAGVSVIMRYTLRLLTLDQLARAAGLVCALELERDGKEKVYGTWPFEIGLWVGKAATPNTLGRKGDGRSDTARSKVNQFKSQP
jgi:hypothetical protein